jgi:hypothetical protein
MRRLLVLIAGGMLVVLFAELARSYSAPCAAETCIYPGEGAILAIGVVLVGFGLVGATRIRGADRGRRSHDISER